MTSRITDYYEDDTTLIPVQLPGSPDLVGTTTTFVARNLDTRAAITPITCTNLTDAGALTIPIATLVATVAGDVVYDEARIIVIDGATQETYPVEFDGRDRFRVRGAL